MQTQTNDLARGVLESIDGDRIVLAVPHTEYKLHLDLTVPAGEISVPPGKHIKGRIEARSLRMHGASGGGSFIEPVWGAPRIVAGNVLSIDEPNRRVLVNAAVPIWVTAPEGQDFSVLAEGGLVNFYVESGTTFLPVVKHEP